MSKNKILLVTVSILILAFAVSAAAQRGPIGQNILVKPKPGHEAEWEAAYKEHLQWHADVNDSWDWATYQLLSGPDAGQYFVRTGNHEWKDFDELGEMESKDTAHYFETAGKHAESHLIWFDRTHWNLSRIPEGAGPYKILEFTLVAVRSGMIPKFMSVVGKYHAAFEKTNSPAVFATAQTENGGSTSDFVFVSLHENYASLEQPPGGISAMMEEAYGRQEAEAIGEDFNACVESMESYIAVRRDDLTYRAPKSTSNE
ncbi:MAG: hypothetical protein BMS9Abin37_0056 [Acidobacteriota bacterium]|nr:MAG: hypothetical protein BMS9Abin37_0056 [Acidobacteriota bacterium]